ncbi:hypothetical protein PybrP1_002003, partial [[Pythium] brassicae (nom. inval.)]
MEREQFLDAQLWLRRVSAADWDALADGDDGEQLLPPPTSESAIAWCCFHVGARLCVFAHSAEDEDATQLELELRWRRSRAAPPLLLARFDRRRAYSVGLRALTAVTAPPQPQQAEALPFGSLELPHVSVRVWMEPQHTAPATARLILQHALLAVQQGVLAARQLAAAAERSPMAQQSSWRDVFRHSRHASGDDGPALQATTPAELLRHARRIFTRDADFEAVKVTCWQVARSSHASLGTRRTRGGDGGADHEAPLPPPRNLDAPLSEADAALLLTELAHIFSDTHDGVNELLGFSPGDACPAHERCVLLRDAARDDTPCITAKWQAWDEFLEASLAPPNAPGSSDSSQAKQAAMNAAASTFQCAIVDAADALVWQQRVEMHRTRIRAFERVGFDAFFPSERPQLAGPPPARQLQQQLKAEQMLAVLLEKRKQLLRDELALSLLPRRQAPDAAVGSGADAEHAKTKQENQLLVKKLHDVVARYKQLQQQYQAVVAEKDVLLGASPSAPAPAVAESADDASRELAAQDAAVKKLEAEKHELIEKLKTVVGTCRVIQKQLQEAKEENETLKSPAKPPTSSSSSSSSSDAANATPSDALAAAARVAELEHALSQTEAEKHELVTKLQEVVARYHSLQQQLEDAVSERAAATATVRALELEVAALTRDKQDAQRDAARSEAAVAELQQQVARLQQQQVARLQQQQDDAEQLYGEAAATLNQTLRANSDLERRLAASLRQREQDAAAVDEQAAARIRELAALLENANCAVADLQQQLASEGSKWERERADFVARVDALTQSGAAASARLRHLEELQSQLDGLDGDVNYEILSPTLDFPKREEIQALAAQVNSLPPVQDAEVPVAHVVPPSADLVTQYDEIRFQMSHIRKRQNSLLAAKENDVLELEQLRETIANLVSEHEASLREKDDRLVASEAVAQREAETALRIRAQLAALVALLDEPSDASAGADAEQLLHTVTEAVGRRAEAHARTVRELSEAVATLREQVAFSHSATADASARADELDREAQTARDENARLAGDMAALRAQMQGVSADCERLRVELSNQTGQPLSPPQSPRATPPPAAADAADSSATLTNIAALERELERAQSSLEESEAVLSSVKAENLRMVFEVAKAADGSVKLKQDYEALLEQQKDKASELETLMRELEAAIAAKLALERELRESQGSLAAQIDELNAEKQALRDSVRQLEAALRELRREKSALEQAIADLKSENDTLEERIHELSATAESDDAGDDDDDVKEREVEELRSSLVQARVEFEQQTRQLTALEKKVAEVSSRGGSPSHHTVGASVAGGAAAAAATEAERKEFQAALIELIDMERKLQAAYETQKSLEAALKEKTESKAELEARLADAEQSLADLEDELAHKMRVSGTIETHLKHSESENQDLMKEHEQVRAKLVQTENLLEEKSIAFEAFRTTSAMLQDERARLQHDIAQLKEQNRELAQQAARAAAAQEDTQQELEEQLTELADKIAQLETDKSEMKQRLERELFQLEDELEDARGWRARADAENAELLEQREQLEAAARELRDQHATLEDQHAELARELAAAHASFSAQLGDAELRAQQVAAASSAREEQLVLLRAEHRALEDAFAQAQDALAAAEADAERTSAE